MVEVRLRRGCFVSMVHCLYGGYCGGGVLCVDDVLSVGNGGRNTRHIKFWKSVLKKTTQKENANKNSEVVLF